MLRSLIHKELREQLPVLLVALGLALLFPMVIAAVLQLGPAERRTLATVATAVPFSYALLVWPIVAAAAAAATQASERAAAEHSYLLTRPVPRLTLWFIKAGVGLATLLIVVLLTDTAARLLSRVAGVTPLSAFMPRDSWPTGGGEELANILILLGPLLVAVTMYFATLLLAPWTQRSLTAAIGGTMLGGGIYLSIFLLWWNLDLLPRLGAPLLLSVLATAALVASAAAWSYVRGELFEGRAPLGRASGAATAALMTAAVGCIGLAAWDARPVVSGGVMSEAVAAGDGRVLVTHARRAGLMSRRVSLLDDSGSDALTARLTSTAAASADGQWVAYVSRRGSFGLRAVRAGLRLRGVSGEERLLADLGGSWSGNWGRPVFAPDGRQVTVAARGHLIGANFDGSAVWRQPLFTRDDGGRRCSLAGWDPQGLLVMVCGASSPIIDIRWYVPGAVDPSRVLTLPTGDWRTGGWDPEAAGRVVRWISLARMSGAGEELVVVELSSGEIASHSLPAVNIQPAPVTADGKVVFAMHDGAPQVDHRIVVRELDLTTGLARDLLDTRGRGAFLSPGPADEWLVAAIPADGELRLVAVRMSDGLQRAIEGPRAIPGVSWLSRSQLLIPERVIQQGVARGWYEALRVLDLETMTERTLRP